MSDTDPSPLVADSADVFIDWTKEPSTERERRLRAAMLGEVLAKPPVTARAELSDMLYLESRTPGWPREGASDIWEAYEAVEAIIDLENAQRVERKRQSRVARALAEIDRASE